MPTYEYVCQSCNANVEVFQTFSEEPLITCLWCGRDELVKLLFPPIVIDTTPKTLGTLADRNASTIGQYKKDSIEEGHRLKKQMAREEMARNLPSGMSIPGVS